MKKNKKKKKRIIGKSDTGSYRRVCANCMKRHTCKLRKRSITMRNKEHCEIFKVDMNKIRRSEAASGKLNMDKPKNSRTQRAFLLKDLAQSKLKGNQLAAGDVVVVDGEELTAVDGEQES